jgi:GNAT superfamily N-acetyltransferase
LAIVVRKLEECDEIAHFDCGDEPLNNYLRRHAWTNQQKTAIGVTYVAVEQCAPGAVLGYFTLAASSLARERFPKRFVRGLPHYDLPLLLLARLAVDRRFQERGLGHVLISEALKIAMHIADEIGCRCIITDAYRDKTGWYARYGFHFLSEAAAGSTQKMFLDVRTIRAAYERAGSSS